MCGMYGMRGIRIVRTCICSALAIHFAGVFRSFCIICHPLEPEAGRYRVVHRLPSAAASFICEGGPPSAPTWRLESGTL